MTRTKTKTKKIHRQGLDDGDEESEQGGSEEKEEEEEEERGNQEVLECFVSLTDLAKQSQKAFLHFKQIYSSYRNSLHSNLAL